MATDEVHSYCFWAKGIDDKERARRAVRAQQMICVLPTETYRRDMDIRNVRIYENNPAVTMFSFAGKYYEDTATMAMPAPEQSVNNKAKAMIDTLGAQIFSTDQRARCFTVDGSIEQELRSIAFQEFADGLAWQLKLHKLRVRAGFDACILESGAGASSSSSRTDGSRGAVYRDRVRDQHPRRAHQRRAAISLSPPGDGAREGVGGLRHR